MNETCGHVFRDGYCLQCRSPCERVKIGIKEAIEAERKACAVAAETACKEWGQAYEVGARTAADAIRARGGK